MNIINNGNSFLLLKYRLTFAAGIKNKIDVMNAIIGKKELTVSNKNLSDALANQPKLQDDWVKLAFDIDQAVTDSIHEHSINPQNIEADIRKKLLPQMFALSKSVGGGMDQAKAIVEMIMQIMRVGLQGQ